MYRSTGFCLHLLMHLQFLCSAEAQLFHILLFLPWAVPNVGLMTRDCHTYRNGQCNLCVDSDSGHEQQTPATHAPHSKHIKMVLSKSKVKRWTKLKRGLVQEQHSAPAFPALDGTTEQCVNMGTWLCTKKF